MSTSRTASEGTAGIVFACSEPPSCPAGVASLGGTTRITADGFQRVGCTTKVESADATALDDVVAAVAAMGDVAPKRASNRGVPDPSLVTTASDAHGGEANPSLGVTETSEA